MDNNNLRNPGVPYASGVPPKPNPAPTPLFADARPAPQAPTQPIPAPTTAAPIAPTLATTPLPPATPPVAAPLATPPAPKKPRDWRKTILIISFSTLFLLFIGAAWLIFEAVRNSDIATEQVNRQISNTNIPLSEFAASGSLNLLGTQSLAVNGQLRANESFVLAPQAQPGKSERGQLYFDANTNRLAYYNGSQFIQIPGEEQTVLTLQGQTGNITLVGGEGVAVNGTTLTNTGITSFGGSTGDITLGSGVNLVDGALINSGILGATAGTGISIVNDGAGNITISNSGAGTGTVNSPNGTAGRIAKFTGVQTIEDSLLSEAGATVTVNGNLNITGTLGLSAPLGVNSGGTGATSLAANGVVIGNGSGALTAVTAGGVGECLISTAGAPSFQACPGGGGGVTALNSLTGALTIANASTAGSTITLNDASTSQKGIAQFNSINFSAASGVINTIQDIAVASAPTFGRLTLTSSEATSPMLLVNNTNGSGTGNLIDLQLNGASRMAVSPAGNMTLTGTVNGQTISSSASFTGTLAVTGAASLNGGATVAGTLTANTITPTTAMTVGATGQSLTLQGNASTTLRATSGASTTTVSFQTPTANVNYRLLTAAAGTYDICTTVGNCAGVGGGVTTPGGTTNTLPKFTGAQTLGDSIITDNGSTVTIGGVLAVNTITPTGALTIGTTGQDLTLQGTNTSLSSTSGGVTNTLSFATPASGNKSIVLPNASGTVVVSASGPLAIDAAGNITCATCALSGSGVTSLNSLTGALSLAYASGVGSTITIQDASTSQKGVAQFDSTNFSASGGVINTIQDIAVASAPTFGRLTVTSSQASNAMLLINNTNAGATGNLLDVQLNGASRLAVTPAGNMTLTGTLNGQTISSSASFTGTLAVTGAASLNGGATVTGTLTANTVTPTSALTVGATTQSFLVQGSASSTITATNGASTTTVAFQTPTANVTYRLLTAAAGTYDICTTVGNCAGVGGGVTTAGGTTNRLAKFTGAQAIGDSIITDNGTTVTIGGTLAVNTITPSVAMTIGAASQDITIQGATTSITATDSGTTNTLTFATPSGAGKTITIPNASGTVAVSASGPLSVDSNGNITCATCVTSGGGGGGVGAVDSLNGLTGALTIANASTGGSTITINDASTSQKGIAQFNSINFSAASGVINTIQNINMTAAPQFGQLTLSSSQASAAMLTVNNTDVSATGNLLDLQLNGASRLAVTPAGNITLTGTLNGQTISSSASFTGTLAVTGATSLNGGATVTGAFTQSGGVFSATSSGSATLAGTGVSINASSGAYSLQGASTSTLAGTSGSFTTTLGFTTPTADTTINLPALSAGTYTLCTTSGNCLGGSGGANTALSNLSGVAINTSLLPGSAGAINLGSGTLPFGDVYLAGSSGTPGTNNFRITGASTSGTRTITLPDASGTVCLQNSSSCGFVTGTSADFIQNQNASTQTTANYWISGSGRADTSLLSPALDRATAGTLTLGATTATALTVGRSGVTTTVNGSLVFNGAAFTATASSTSSMNITGSLNLTASAASTWQTTSGNLTIRAAGTSSELTLENTSTGGTINIGGLTNNARTINVGVGTGGTQTQTVTVGSTGGSSITTIQAGSGNIVLNSGGTIELQDNTNVTGTLAVSAAASLNGGATVTGVLAANTITPSSTLTVGATGQSFTLQGNSSSTITATNSGSTTSLVFQTPTANATFRFLTAAAGTYDICTTATVCSGYGSTSGNANYIQNQIGSQQPSSNYWISGTGRADTSLLTPLIDTASAVALNIGTTNATVINLNENVAVATGKNLQIVSGDLDMNGFDVTNGGATDIDGALTVNSTGFFQAGSDSTTAFNIRNAGGGNMFTVNTTGSAIGVNLGGAVTPSLANGGLEVQGGIRISGTDWDMFTTPHTSSPSSVAAKLNIAATQIPAFGQQIAVGVTESTDFRARGITVFDARTIAHQPSLAVSSPDENNIMGFSWDGSNTIGYIKNSAANIGINVAGSDIANFNTSAVSLLQNSTVTAGRTFTVTSGQTSLTGATTGDALVVSNSTSTGNIAVFRDNATAVATIADGGAAVFRNSTNGASAFSIQNSSNDSLFNVDSSNSQISLLGNGSGGLASWQTNATTLPAGKSSHTVVTNNGYVYVLGGSFGATVYYAKLNADGSVGTWVTSGNSLPASRTGATSAVVNGYVYVIGGYGGVASASTVYYAKLNADGSVGTWNTAANPLPAARAFGGGGGVNGYLYYVGGMNSGDHATVYYAKVNADGSVGTWVTSGNSLPAARTNAAVTFANNYIYALGGENSGTQSTSYYAPIADNGSVGAWNTTTSLPAARSAGSAVVSNGYIYFIGGYDSSSTSTVYYSRLAANGTVGAWSTTSNIPATRSEAGAITVNGYLYYIGGSNSSFTEQDSVYYASTARVTIGGNLDLVSIQGINLAGGNDYGGGSVGGNITAGNGTFVGALQVQSQANFANNVAIGGTSSVQGDLGVNGNVTLGDTTGDTIQVNGVVGIGTAAPGSRLEVIGDTTGDALRISNSTSTGNIAVFSDNATAVVTIADGGAATFQNSADGTTAFRVLKSSGGGGTAEFTVDTTNSRVYIGNPTADSTGSLLVLDTKNTSGDPTGVNGAMYYNSAIGAMRCYVEGAWRFCNEPLSLSYGYNMDEDFLMDTGEGTPGQFGWGVTYSGTNAGVGSVAPDVSTRPGQVSLETGTTSSGWGGMYHVLEGIPQIILGSGEIIEMAVNIDTLATVNNQDYEVRLGLCDEDEVDCTDGLYFEYNVDTSPNWIYAAANNGTRTKATSSKAVVANTWVNFRIVVTSTTTADFYVRNDGESSFTHLGTLTSANFPITAARATRPQFAIVKEAGSTERTMRVDYFHMRRLITNR